MSVIRHTGCTSGSSGLLLPGWPASVNPLYGDPLRSGVDLLERPLQDADRLVDVVVDDGQVKVVAVGLEEGRSGNVGEHVVGLKTTCVCNVINTCVVKFLMKNTKNTCLRASDSLASFSRLPS